VIFIPLSEDSGKLFLITFFGGCFPDHLKHRTKINKNNLSFLKSNYLGQLRLIIKDHNERL
ncbi:MAG: hypothetical protein JXR46_10010, partial [Calditrichaceae bacterium]|nr:hypothetical protein [Calditrichaceae bacterium]MBN2709369.1 hypothetical protein [Calditrichaceae bacterium]